ncbi:hypothetical protein DYB26_002325 [Aphanomyces astaci]|uniref:Uncharacterized protein n=1 Tax=Aphanomyces astaci TaxID=112090 RepID=A0A3R7AJP1_APHAT|nr:hypothetical protein DYB26_002325 [Aphanomyces astaci]
MGGSASEVLSKSVGIPDTPDDVVGYCTDLTEAAETIPYSLQRRTIITVDFPGIVEGLHVDMEERMLPLTKADVAYQVRKIRDRRANPTLQEIAEVVIHAIKRKVTDADLQRLESPADLDDPKRWLHWFANALVTCEESHPANRNFNDERTVLVASTRWARFQRMYLRADEIPSVGPLLSSPSLVGR